MPGWTERHPWSRCPECGGPDIGNAGFWMHYPTCSTQPGHDQARKQEAKALRKRRREIDALVASADARRLRELRTIGRLP